MFTFLPLRAASFYYKIGIFPRANTARRTFRESCKPLHLLPHANCLHFTHVLIIVHKQSQALAAPWNAI